MNRCCISLLTDFGLQDTYVGQMKGVIAGINPDATVVDLTHAIPPQQIRLAAFALADAIDAFPDGTIHVAVVDPGVGSCRRAIAAEIGVHKFVCPDNGLLTAVLERYTLKRFVELDQPRFWRSGVSRTFHGRDIFAPAAAAWSRGIDLAQLGTAINHPLVTLHLPHPVQDRDPGTGRPRLNAMVMGVDHFGNLITNLTRSQLPPDAKQVEIRFAGQSLSGIAECYADHQEGSLLALFGSSEKLEIAVANGNAAAQLKVGAGESIHVCWTTPPT